MKGIRFYEELENKGRKAETSRGTVFAAFVDRHAIYGGAFRGYLGDWQYEGVGAVFDHPDSPVCGGAASCDYLRYECRRISEARAREIHPTLFVVLDQI